MLQILSGKIASALPALPRANEGRRASNQVNLHLNVKPGTRSMRGIAKSQLRSAKHIDYQTMLIWNRNVCKVKIYCKR